jgi:hypothetical protein
MAISDILGTAVSLGRSLLAPSLAVDVVAITADGFTPLFPAARPMQASVFEIAKLMDHPLETGSVISDHIVFDPIEIRMPMICVGEISYRATYATIKAVYLAGTVLSVVTRTGVYSSMVIAEIPHEEDPAHFNAIQINIRLREAKFVTPQTGKLTTANTDASKTSTVSRGAQTASTAPTAQAAKATSSYGDSGLSKGSTLYRWFN